MKLKKLIAFAGLAPSMILSAEAHAEFTGLSIVKHTSVSLLGGVPRDIYRLDANFDNPLDSVQAVLGEPSIGGGPSHPLTIQNRNALDTGLGTGFYNGAYDVPPFPLAVGSLPQSFYWSTLYTIGIWTGSQGVIASMVNNPLPSFIPGTEFTSDQIMWFVEGNPISATAGFTGDNDPLLRVGLGQFTVRAGEHVRGTISLQVNLAGAPDGATQTIHDLTFNSFPVPAPAAIAMISLAGLVRARRRRDS